MRAAPLLLALLCALAACGEGGMDKGPLDAGSPDGGALDMRPRDGGPAEADAGLTDLDAQDLGADSGSMDSGGLDPPDQGLDLGPLDVEQSDMGAPDSALDSGLDDLGADAGPGDQGALDAGSPDLGPLDAGAQDLGQADLGPPDIGLGDLGADAGPVDIGADGGLDLGPEDSGPQDLGALPSFGASGFALGAAQGFAGGGQDRLMGAAVDAQGRLVAAGFSQTAAGGSRGLLLRYRTDGSLDPSFSADGVVLGPADGAPQSFSGPTGDDRFLDVAIDAQGRIIVAGQSGDGGPLHRTLLARYLPDGQLDPSFGLQGGFTLGAGADDFSGPGPGPDERLSALSLDSAGRIVAAGIAAEILSDYFYTTLIARFTADGQLDPSFSGDGYHIGAPGGGGWFTGSYDELFDVTVSSGDTVVAVGWTANPSFSVERTLVLRMTAQGAFDPTFNGQGFALGPTTSRLGGTKEVSTGVVIDPAGRVVVTGFCFDASNLIRTFVERYTQAGSFDPSFNMSGFALGLPSIVNQAAEYPRSALVDPQGRVLIGGFTDDSGAAGDNTDRGFLRRYTPQGADDQSFNLSGAPLMSAIDTATQGSSELGGGLDDGFFRLALGPGETIYAVGTSASRALVVRYRADGCLDAPGPCAN